MADSAKSTAKDAQGTASKKADEVQNTDASKKVGCVAQCEAQNTAPPNRWALLYSVRLRTLRPPRRWALLHSPAALSS